MKTALRLNPNSGEAHLALAEYYFRGYRDYPNAQAELALARPTLPNNVAVFVLSGYLDRRQRRWSESESNFRKAVELDPRNSNAVHLLADHFILMRRSTEALRVFERAAAAGLAPPVLKLRRAAIAFLIDGEIAPFRAMIETASPELDIGGGTTPWCILAALAEGDFAGARQVLTLSPRENFQETDYSFYYPRAWYEAEIARAQDDEAGARRAFMKARKIFEDRLSVKPDDARTLAVLAQVDAGLGQKELAIREAQRAVGLMPVTRDAYDGPLVLQGLARVYTWTGEPGRAIDLVERLLKMPGYLSYGYLLHDPLWAPLREHARFQALVASLAPGVR